MKKSNIISLFLLISGLLTMNLHCEKDETTNPNDQLPPYTQIGANTMGCLVNGKVFVPKFDTKSYFGCHDNDLTLYIDRDRERVYIALNDKSVIDTGEYDLTYIETKRIAIYYPPPFAKAFGTNPTHTGKLHIRYWDKQKHIMAGTFYFDAVREDSALVHITQGRFDMVYN